MISKIEADKIDCCIKMYDEFLTYRFSSLNEDILYRSRTSLIERLGGTNIGKNLIIVGEIFTDDEVLYYDVDVWIKAFILCK